MKQGTINKKVLKPKDKPKSTTPIPGIRNQTKGYVNAALSHKIDPTVIPAKKSDNSMQNDAQGVFSKQRHSITADNGFQDSKEANIQEIREEDPSRREVFRKGPEFVESSLKYSDKNQEKAEIIETDLKMQEKILQAQQRINNSTKNLKSGTLSYQTIQPRMRDCKTPDIKQKSKLTNNPSKIPEKIEKPQLKKENSKSPEKKKFDYNTSKIPDKIENIPMIQSIEVEDNSNISRPPIIVSIKPLSFEMNSEKYPETVTPYWIPIEEMKKISPYSQNFKKNVDKLKENGFIGWKRSRGDGNCYYRAIMNNYIRLVFEVHRNVHFATSFLRLVESINFPDENINPPGFRERQKVFINIIDYLRRIKAKNPVQAFIEFNKFTQDQEFDKLCFEIGRVIAAKTLIERQNDENYKYFIFDDLDFLVSEILKHGEEAGDLGLMMLPLGLNIQIQIFSFFDNQLNLTKYPEDFEISANSLPPICVVRRSGHYDILCSNKELDGNMYDFDTGSYSFIIENNKKLQKDNIIF